MELARRSSFFVRTALLLGTAGLVSFSTHSRAETSARQPISHQALWQMPQVGAPEPSPDGRWAVVSVRKPAYDDADDTSDLWLVAGDGATPPRQLTTHKGRESSASWSPDGTRIAFTAKRAGDDASQVYLLDLAGGEARRLTTLALGARQPQWSPDGRWLLVQAPVHRGATNDASNRQLADQRKRTKSKVRAYDSFPIRNWDKWLDDTQTHVWIVPLDGSQPPRDLLACTRLVESRGFRGAGGEGSSDSLQPTWAPDGKSIVITATTDGDVAAHAQPTFGLFEVSLEGGEPRRLTETDTNASSARFTPDGSWIVFQTNAEVGRRYYALNRLTAAAWPWRGGSRVLTQEFDRSVDDFTLSPDSRWAYFTADDSGHAKIWKVPIAGGTAALVMDAPQGVWGSPRLPERAATPVLFASYEAAHQPAEAFRIDLTTGTSTRLTDFTLAQAAAIDWPPLRSFWFTNTVGRRIHSFLALPPGFDEGKKYPLLVLIHGGHQSMWRDAITKRWNYHLLAEPGYVVLLTDYVGSTGYGEAFTLSILGDPLRGPADDINATADEAIRRFSYIDGSRQAAAGASYGGHLVNWLEGTTTRYKCLIGHAGLASLYSQWATSDAIHHRELMMDGPFWQKPEAWLAQSPATYADRFQTPLLLSVGEADYRVPLNNTLEMWSLLQRQKVPSRLLVWPDENHWILKSENSRVFYQEVHAWLKRWL
jgi:dipeptidyl aminopeptidase/acylaminoacyl peptidase